MREIIPTIVPTSFEHLEAEIARLRGFARAAHIDAGDGTFVPNTTWLPAGDESLPATNALLFEAHLMVQEPLELGVRFAKAGASRIIAHFESFSETSTIERACSAWREAGAKEVVLALKIDTPIEDAAPFLHLVDGVLIMTIANIGAQGQAFDAHGLERISAMSKQFPLLPITADGGINENTIHDVATAGASRMCVGAALAAADDPAALYQRLSHAANAV